MCAFQMWFLSIFDWKKKISFGLLMVQDHMFLEPMVQDQMVLEHKSTTKISKKQCTLVMRRPRSWCECTLIRGKLHYDAFVYLSRITHSKAWWVVYRLSKWDTKNQFDIYSFVSQTVMMCIWQKNDMFLKWYIVKSTPEPKLPRKAYHLKDTTLLCDFYILFVRNPTICFYE